MPTKPLSRFDVEWVMFQLHRICGSMHEVRWSWVHRDLNRAAHEAAMIGVRAMELESWVSRPPLSLVQVLVSDGLPCPP
ncbi:hypothetical protein L3X38_013192 [Prunus dulcis]|uniref:RNase H type-1 domain-containing protein n=1 Tax=Prunus dulcis TaxID=3755 RepID=A0AAD4WKV9_PRUDU|nr:hypothetical protein L3X38_013192 [Prunus dulcis]